MNRVKPGHDEVEMTA